MISKVGMSSSALVSCCLNLVLVLVQLLPTHTKLFLLSTAVGVFVTIATTSIIATVNGSIINVMKKTTWPNDNLIATNHIY